MNTRSMFNRPAKLLAVGGLLFAALLAGQVQAAIINGTIIGSKHDLTAGTNSIYTNNTSAEPCAFCHTPHGASATVPQLWNRPAGSITTFTLYTSTTLGTTAAAPGANSLMCLSCHDGATALDLIINKPGSGGLNTAGLSAGYAWVGVTGTNQMLATSAATIGLAGNLANDHPISVPFCGGLNGAACRDLDFKTTNLYLDAVQTGLPNTTTGSTTGWWLETGANGIGASTTRDKSDLPLYNTAGVLPMVQCATCHEPHNPGNGTFLRISNTKSNLCTTCHNK